MTYDNDADSVKHYRSSNALKYNIVAKPEVGNNYTTFDESSACQIVYKVIWQEYEPETNGINHD